MADEWTEYYVKLAVRLLEDDENATIPEAPVGDIQPHEDLRNETPPPPLHEFPDEHEDEPAEEEEERSTTTSADNDSTQTLAYELTRITRANGIDRLMQQQFIDDELTARVRTEALRKEEREQRLHQAEEEKEAAFPDYVAPEEWTNPELDEAVQAKLALPPSENFGSRVVFIDLEWHTLDKRAQVDMTESLGRALVTAHICQICAISSDYALRFNQYISYRKLKKPWRKLVEDWNILEWSPQDDPRIAVTFEDCIEMFIDTFQENTLFLSYGNTDAMSIFKFLYADADFDPLNGIQDFTPEQYQRREAARARIMKKNWRWANVMPWIKATGKPLEQAPNNMKIGGALGSLYDTLFHKSLWTTMRTPQHKEPRVAVPPMMANFLKDPQTDILVDLREAWTSRTSYGLVPRSWIEVRHNRHRQGRFKNMYPQFWNTRHLEPVFHVAHTDTIMLINCVAVLSLTTQPAFNHLTEKVRLTASRLNPVQAYIEREGIVDKRETSKLKGIFEKATKSIETRVYNSVATSIIDATKFFRMHQLSLSESAAQQMWNWHCSPVKAKGKEVERSSTSADLVRRVYVLSCRASGMPQDPELLKRWIDDSLEADEYEVEKILSHRMSTYKWHSGRDPPEYKRLNDTKQLEFQLLWKGYPEPWWEWSDGLGGAKALIRQYFKELKPPDPKAEAVFETDHQTKQSKRKATTTTTTKQQRNAITEEAKELQIVRDFEEVDLDDPAEYYLIEIPTGGPMNAPYRQLVMTKRKGKFTDKVKAIRNFLLENADETLRKELVLEDHRYAEKRRIHFSMNPKKSYVGLPWFSMPTSAAEPNTQMLHTMACRNLSDPEDRTKTRKWAELDVMLWDFDLIVQHDMFVNTKFRFCKECKEYTDIVDPQSSGDPTIDAFVRLQISSPPSRPVAKKKQLLAQQQQQQQQHQPPSRSSTVMYRQGEATESIGEESVGSNTSTSTYSSHYSVTRHVDGASIHRHRTNTVSYFALLQARIPPRRR